MNLRYKKARTEIYGLRRKAEIKPRQCANLDCTEKIKEKHSHALQKAILKNISNGGHVYSVSDTRQFFSNENKFIKLGINQASRFIGFCPRCDDHVFAELEKSTSEKKNIPRLIRLLSYRALIYEYRKIENTLNWYEEIQRKSVADFYIANIYDTEFKILHEKFKQKIKWIESNLWAFDMRLYAFEQKISGGGDGLVDSFRYRIKKIEKKEIYCSAFGCHLSRWVYDSSFFHLIPCENYSLVIICFLDNNPYKDDLKDVYNPIQLLYDEMPKKNPKSIGQLISDILIMYTEEWCVSPQYYSEKIKPIETIIKNNFKLFLDINNKLTRKNTINIID